MSALAPRCRTHHQPAGWKCTACKSPLCPDCAGIQRTMHVEMTVCGLCRELANPLTRHRIDEASYLQRLPGAFAWPFITDVTFSLAGIAGFVAVLSYFSGFGRVVASLGLYASSYAIIRMTASNQNEFFVESAGWNELIGPVIKSGLIYVMLGIAAALYIAYFKPKGAGVASYLFDPVLWVLVLAAFVLGPMTTLMAACHTSLWQMLNPFLVVAYIGKIGVDYFIALVALLIVTVVGGLVGLGLKPLALLPVGFIGTAASAIVEVYFAFVSARMLGLLLYVRGDRVGYGPRSDYEAPLLGTTQPRGKLPEKAVREVDASIPEVMVPGMSDPFDSASPMEMLQPGEFPERTLDAAELPSMSEHLARSVRESAARGDWAEALDAWKASPDKAALGLDVEHLTGLGRTAASQGDNAVAREVLELAATGDPAEAARARAKVFLAKLLKERFNDAPAAEALFKEVIAAAPGTDAAKFAQKMLGP